MQKHLLPLLACLLLQNLRAQIVDRSFSTGFVSEVEVLKPLGSDRWLLAGTGVPSAGDLFSDTLFVIVTDNAGQVLLRTALDAPHAERHFFHDVLVLPDGSGAVAVFESTLCDVVYDQTTLQKLDFHGQIVWELTENIGSGPDLPRTWAVAPDGNLLGVDDQKFLWKINADSGDPLWKRKIRANDNSAPTFWRYVILPGTEDLLATGNPAFQLWRPDTLPGGTVEYKLAKSKSLPAIPFFDGLMPAQNGWAYLFSRLNAGLSRVDADLNFETLPTQAAGLNTFFPGADGLYFSGRHGSENIVQKTDFSGGQPETWTVPDNWLMPQKIAASGSAIAIGGTDGSGPNSILGSASEYPRFDAAQAWLRIIPLGGPTAEPTKPDIAVTEIEQRQPLSVTVQGGGFPSGDLYSLSGGNFRAKIKNLGQTTVNQAFVNIRFKPIIDICFWTPAKKVLFNGSALGPGETAWVEFGDISAPFQPNIPAQFCFWTSGPNDMPDAAHANDFFCKDILLDGGFEPNTAQFWIYPNPAPTGASFWVDFGAAGFPGGEKWQMFDVLGRLVAEGGAAGGAARLEVPVGSLAAGVYLFLLKNRAVRVVLQR